MLQIKYAPAPVSSPAHEQWAELKVNSNSRYLISTLGRLYSIGRSRLLKGRITNGNVMFDYTLTLDKSPFPFVRTGNKLAKASSYNRTAVSFGRLVANTFLPRPEGCNIVLHENHNPKDNCLANLKWGVYGEVILENRTTINKKNEGNIVKIKKILGSKKRPRIKEIAAKFGLSEMSIYRIQNGEAWSNVPGYKKHKATPVRLSPDSLKTIRLLLTKGVTGAEIAKKFNTTPTTISRIKNGHHYKV